MIEAYLAELGRALPRVAHVRRRRILREAGAHLDDAASALEREGMPRAEAENEAVRRFGPAAVVAREFAPILVASALRRGAAWLLAGVLLTFPVVYGLTENLLPPATWAADATPFELRWKVRTLVALLTTAGLGAVLSMALARPRRPWLALIPGTAAVVSLAAAVAVAVALAADWAGRVPAAGGAWVAAILAAGALLAPGLVLAAGAARAVVVERRQPS